jgi:SAM-dependent methyltransferase
MRSFAVADGRSAKARKIEAVLEADTGRAVARLRILDVGTGSGHIAAHFARSNDVVAADVECQLSVPGAEFQFVRIDGDRLPFPDASFDVVILNQVLTYVPDQELELAEVRRILRPSGRCYVSLPNRLFPRDPHTGWPLLHYLPEPLYAAALRRITGANEIVRMHTPAGMSRLFASSGFNASDYTVAVLSNPDKFRDGKGPRLPSWRWLGFASPTNIFVLHARA